MDRQIKLHRTVIVSTGLYVTGPEPIFECICYDSVEVSRIKMNEYGLKWTA